MRRPWDAIVWWEIRRIPFNLLILVVGIASGFVALVAWNHVYAPAEDLGNPFVTVVFYALAANLCYTMGWVSEILWSWGDTAQTEKARPKVFRVGLIFSAGLTLLPAIVLLLTWATRRFR